MQYTKWKALLFQKKLLNVSEKRLAKWIIEKERKGNQYFIVRLLLALRKCKLKKDILNLMKHTSFNNDNRHYFFTNINCFIFFLFCNHFLGYALKTTIYINPQRLGQKKRRLRDAKIVNRTVNENNWFVHFPFNVYFL